MKSRIAAIILVLVAFLTSAAFSSGEPDLVVKVIKDDLAKNKRCTIGVLKSGSFKNVDTRYKILSFDFYLLNSRGKAKWHKTLKKSDIDLSKEDVDVRKGDLVVIDNIDIVHIKSGEYIKVKKVTDRYLVR
jgi:hypothetical protein